MTKSLLKSSLLLALGAALVAAPASAQIGWSLGAGVTMPQGDYGDAFGSGFNAMGAATFTLPAAPIKIRADLGYHMSKIDGGADVSSNILAVSGDAQWTVIPGPLAPYVIGGVTWQSASFSGSDAGGADSQSDFGFNVGGGLDFGLGALKLFAEARYISAGDYDYLPITVGIHF